MAERLKTLRAPSMSKIGLRRFIELKQATFILNNRFFKKKFLYYSYANFHSHLPEELFFDDFSFEFKKASTQTYKQFGSAFDEIDKLDS